MVLVKVAVRLAAVKDKNGLERCCCLGSRDRNWAAFGPSSVEQHQKQLGPGNSDCSAPLRCKKAAARDVNGR